MNRTRFVVSLLVVLVLVAGISTWAQSGSTGLTLSTGTMTSGAIFNEYNLDREPTVWCDGWDHKTNKPFGCKQAEEWTIAVTYNKQLYRLSRLDLRRAIESAHLKPIKK